MMALLSAKAGREIAFEFGDGTRRLVVPTSDPSARARVESQGQAGINGLEALTPVLPQNIT